MRLMLTSSVFFDALLTGIVICQLSVWWSGGFKHDSWVIQVLGVSLGRGRTELTSQTWVVAGGLTYTVVSVTTELPESH